MCFVVCERLLVVIQSGFNNEVREEQLFPDDFRVSEERYAACGTHGIRQSPRHSNKGAYPERLPS